MTDDDRRISEVEARVRPTIKDGVGKISAADFETLISSRLAWKYTAKCFAEPIVQEGVALDRAIDRMGWKEINAFRAELAKGQSIYEDAGGYFIRAIRRLFGLPELDEEVISYQRAAREMVAASLEN